MSAALEKRIAAAFTEGATSTDVVILIGEAEAVATSSAGAADQARKRALDPALSADDVAAARRDMEDSSFVRDRLQEAVRRLGDLLCKVKADEEQARRRLAYNAALVERDQLANELGLTYPALAAQLAKLAARIAANDALLDCLNRKSLPNGVPRLDSAELVARGLRGFVDGNDHVPRIATALRLPAFEYSGREPFAWPRSE